MHGNNKKNLLIGYPYHKLAETPCFSYYLLCFLFNNIGKQEGRTGFLQGGGSSPNNVTH
jgi:hypothetical protein